MGERIEILLVDDQPHFAELAKAFLEDADSRFDVDAVTSPEAALARLGQRSYDCIVSDQEMPAMTGLELFDAVEARDIDVPFILFTGMDIETIDGDDRAEGVSAYLQKGGANALETLAQRIRVTVSEHRADRNPLDVETRYTALFEQHVLPMAWVHANGGGPSIVDHNERFVEEFELDAEVPEVIPLEQALSDMNLDTTVIERSLETGEPMSADIERVSDGDVDHYRWQVVPVDDGDPSHALMAVHDITHEASNEQQLEMYQAIVEASGDPMYVLDITGTFVYVNDAMVELTGFDRDVLIGSKGTRVMCEADYERGTELIKNLLRSDHDTDTFEMDVITAGGEIIPSENHITLLYDVETGTGREVKGTAGVLRDISDRKQRIAELQRYNERLEELAAFISHDLRNPLNIATGHLKLLDPDEGKRHYGAIARALSRMEQLIDDLLLLAQSGQSVIDPEPLELAELARLSWSQVSAERASIVVRTDRTIVGDSSRIRQLLENLFANAVNHGDETVQITVGQLPGGFYVADDGPGIPEERRDSVFDFGYTTGDDGTGFGLSIVKAVAEAHDWSVSVTESESGGARFEFTGVETAHDGACRRA